MKSKKIIQEIKKRKWFFGIRRGESIFFYSAKYHNREQLTKKEYQNNFVETVLIPKSKNNFIRVFNLKQAKSFHQESQNKILKNQQILSQKIDQDNNLWKEILQLSKQIEKKVIWQNNYEKSLKIFKKLIEKYGIYGTDFFTIFSQGMALEKNKDKFKKSVQVILKKHDKWRNSVAFKEEKLGESFYIFLKFIIEKKQLKVTEKEMMNLLTYQEILDLAEEKSNNREIEKKIERRKKNDCIFLFLKNKNYQNIVIDNKEIISYFLDLLKKEESKSSKEIEGQVAFGIKNKIKGKVIVIEDKNILGKLNPNLNNKILVTLQTSPHFIPYLKKVKAIITDEGGITCHAAIIARELKIPCIVGTKNATQILKDKDLIEIDTDKGTIKILNK